MIEFLAGVIYLLINFKTANYHPCLEVDLNKHEKCPIYRGPRMYIREKMLRNGLNRYIDVFESKEMDLPWESLNMLTIPWDPFLKNVERKIGQKYPDVWISKPKFTEDKFDENVPIIHPFMPKDYYKKAKKITKTNMKKVQAPTPCYPVIASIIFLFFTRLSSYWASCWRKRKQLNQRTDDRKIKIVITE